MLKTEVTQELYETVMGENPSHFKGLKNACEFLREAMEHRRAFVSTKALRRPEARYLRAEDLER